MLYLAFAGFFLIYVLLGWFTDTVEMSAVGGVLSVAFFFGNLYLFWREKRNASKNE
ncbi:hypothetical protein [Halobacillus kuroshimensis]|uniref:hypothetical protein n=1 Tax=Halobacillus kuroshimensis TaxID=302481 RepID=UPI00041297E2|nr:hypothetical protein [Halobacillus kuroshimensis]